jgi:hypothetical protein
LENRSFGNLLGTFPGANGISRAGQSVVQRCSSGTPYRFLSRTPGPFDVESNVPEVRALTLPQLPNEPFAIDRVIPGMHSDNSLRNDISNQLGLFLPILRQARKRRHPQAAGQAALDCCPGEERTDEGKTEGNTD